MHNVKKVILIFVFCFILFVTLFVCNLLFIVPLETIVSKQQSKITEIKSQITSEKVKVRDLKQDKSNSVTGVNIDRILRDTKVVNEKLSGSYVLYPTKISGNNYNYYGISDAGEIKTMIVDGNNEVNNVKNIAKVER